MEDPVADDEFTPYEWTGAEAEEFRKDFPVARYTKRTPAPSTPPE